MHKRFKLHKTGGIPCAKKSRFRRLERMLLPVDNQEDEKEFYLLKYFPGKKVKTGLEKLLLLTGGKNAGTVHFFRTLPLT